MCFDPDSEYRLDLWSGFWYHLAILQNTSFLFKYNSCIEIHANIKEFIIIRITCFLTNTFVLSTYSMSLWNFLNYSCILCIELLWSICCKQNCHVGGKDDDLHSNITDIFSQKSSYLMNIRILMSLLAKYRFVFYLVMFI